MGLTFKINVPISRVKNTNPSSELTLGHIASALTVNKKILFSTMPKHSSIETMSLESSRI